MATTTIKINGMTCDHCVKRVTKEISTIPGVSTVAVDLAAGTVTFDSENDIPRDALAAAIDEAGFTLA
ncbi:heavy-metal-associated domain-containing protein [Lawsonella clevelandensis]|uniref:heavy-metal-associated domain-containing protein n=1 Tax=Lawsonella clevelandensis TaxID=1528099 RepID=UPI001C402C82|nr:MULTISPECIES: cation transporter [Bacteria]